MLDRIKIEKDVFKNTNIGRHFQYKQKPLHNIYSRIIKFSAKKEFTESSYISKITTYPPKRARNNLILSRSLQSYIYLVFQRVE